MKKRVLITGGIGAVGLSLARHLSDQGQEVVVVDDLSRGVRDADAEEIISRPNVKFIYKDLTLKSTWDNIGSGYDYIYHLAAVNGTKFFYEKPHVVLRNDMLTTIYVLDWMREKNPDGKIMFTSSSEAYAGGLISFNQLPIPTPEDVPLVISDPHNARWSYGGTKALGEMFFIHYGEQYGLRTCIVRPYNFYGPRMGHEHVIPDFIDRISKKVDPFPIYGADNTRTFTYLPESVEALQLIMESDKTDGKTYHVGRGPEDEISMEDLARLLFKVAGWEPKELDIKKAPEGSVLRRAPDVSRVKEELGWEAKVSLEEGLKDAYQWYIKNPKT